MNCLAFFGPSEGEVTFATENNAAVMQFNQLRQKIGVVYGNPETTTGGNAPGEVVDLASAAGLFEKAGAFCSFRGERIGQRRGKASA